LQPANSEGFVLPLHVFPIRIPPLQERKEDIPQLVSYFVQKFAKQMQKKIEAISPAVMKGLTAWDWPGNIRELENFIERAVIVTRGKSLRRRLENSVKQIRSRSRMPRRIASSKSLEKEQICKATKPALLTNMKEGSVMRSYGR